MLVTRVEFSVPVVFGKGRPRFARGHAYTPKETREKERLVGDCYRLASYKEYGQVVKAPAGVPVTVEITLYKPLPKSRPLRVLFEFFTVKPDIDNAAKGVLDGLNGVAYVDDAQVTKLVAVKADRTRNIEEETLIQVTWEDPNGTAEP